MKDTTGNHKLRTTSSNRPSLFQVTTRNKEEHMNTFSNLIKHMSKKYSQSLNKLCFANPNKYLLQPFQQIRVLQMQGENVGVDEKEGEKRENMYDENR